MALKYSDVDFEKKCITIKSNRTVAKKREAGGRATGGVNAVESSPKTKRSMAVIPVSELAIQILRDMLAEETDGYNGYIANDGGKPLVESAFRRRFNSLLKQAHVEHCGLHTLRHTFASKLFAATNGNAKLVSELVRHSSVYNGPRELDHGIEKMREHGIMRLSKGRSANHVIQNVHVGIQGEGSH